MIIYVFETIKKKRLMKNRRCSSMAKGLETAEEQIKRTNAHFNELVVLRDVIAAERAQARIGSVKYITLTHRLAEINGAMRELKSDGAQWLLALETMKFVLGRRKY
jgi:hypothetical protein